MIQWIWYHSLRLYVWCGLHYYFKEITVCGKENIPNGSVIFAVNHQNALLDALLIVCPNSYFTHFLTRADIFKKPFLRWLLSTFKMLPVYRLRDGWQTLGENQNTFDTCSEIFRQQGAVGIFPEGNHGAQRRIRPLSKGFTRLVFDALQKYPTLKINIVPVGLNFSAHQSFRSSVSIYYGTPILANNYFNDPLPAEAIRLRNDLSDRLKKLTTHVEDTSQYDEIIQKLEITNPNYLDPIETNQRIAKIEKGEALPISQIEKSGSSLLVKLIHFLSVTINFPPLMAWKKIKKGIKDPVFVASVKFGFGVFAFPVYYFLISLIVYQVWGIIGSAICLLICIPSLALGHLRSNG